MNPSAQVKGMTLSKDGQVIYSRGGKAGNHTEADTQVGEEWWEFMVFIFGLPLTVINRKQGQLLSVKIKIWGLKFLLLPMMDTYLLP